MITVYPENRSILSELTNAVLWGSIVRFGEEAWSKVSGNNLLSGAERAKRVDQLISDACVRAFGTNRIVVETESTAGETNADGSFMINTIARVYGRVSPKVQELTLVARLQQTAQ
jgi:hypothetical protein